MKKIEIVNSYEDFRKVYELFQREPFYEAWTEEGFKEEFNFLKECGEIFGCYDGGEIVGLSNLLFEAQESQPVRFVDPTRVMYISDIAVLREFRGKGYAKALADFVIEYTAQRSKYDEMYLRTNLEGSMSEKIFLDRGFEVMYDNGQIITQDVSFPRTRSDISEVDTRKFLSKKLERR